MNEKAVRDSRNLIAFWDGAFRMTDQEKEKERRKGPDAWKDLAPSQKLFDAAKSLGACRKVLDYGCGSGWAGIIAAKSGCADVTAVDAAEGAAEAARFYASLYGADGRMKIARVPYDWLSSVPDGSYDGLFCSNVLDVVPPETADEIIRQAARAAMDGAGVIVGLNYYLSEEAATARGITLAEGNQLFMDGVLRLVSRPDSEWEALFSPFFEIERLEYFAWPGEGSETRRLFWLKKRSAR